MQTTSLGSFSPYTIRVLFGIELVSRFGSGYLLNIGSFTIPINVIKRLKMDI
jgi:hypothetical protein